MISLSVVIITKNEAHNIVRCLEAVRTIADEIVIVDSGSTDETAALCQLYQARFISHPFQDYMQQKNYATQQASSPYILSLDADEVVSTALLNAIQAAKQNWQYDVYVLQRLNNYCGQWIRHGGWYPDRKIRLFDRRKAAWGAGAVHERLLPQPDATIGTLTGDLLHYSYSSIAEHVARNNRYTTQIATFAFQQGKTTAIHNILLSPIFAFLKTYVLKAGFLDGYYGWVIAALAAQYNFLKHAKLHDLWRNKAN